MLTRLDAIVGLWEMPLQIVGKDDSAERNKETMTQYLYKTLDLPLNSLHTLERKPLGQVIHIFSHIRLTLKIEKLALKVQDPINPWFFPTFVLWMWAEHLGKKLNPWNITGHQLHGAHKTLSALLCSSLKSSVMWRHMKRNEVFEVSNMILLFDNIAEPFLSFIHESSLLWA